MNLKIDKFVLAIILVVIAAYFYPYLAEGSSAEMLNIISSVGISLIFFFYGLKLSPDQIKQGLKNWKLHTIIQASTFIIFPVLVLSTYPFITEDTKILWLAFMFLAALPSTVSSSVVMVSIAKGNIPAAIFNASISGLIGVVVTPLWMGFFLQTSSTNYDLIEVYQKLVLEILGPVILGLILRRYLGEFALKHRAKITLFDKSIILLIIYKSFSKSFLDNIFENISLITLFYIFLLVMLLFWLVYFFIKFMVKTLNFNIEDQITAQFCGTKKSLVHGTVFSKILFQNTPYLGIILLPIMIFHASQILIISIIATKHAKTRN